MNILLIVFTWVPAVVTWCIIDRLIPVSLLISSIVAIIVKYRVSLHNSTNIQIFLIVSVSTAELSQRLVNCWHNFYYTSSISSTSVTYSVSRRLQSLKCPELILTYIVKQFRRITVFGLITEQSAGMRSRKCVWIQKRDIRMSLLTLFLVYNLV